MILPNNLPFHCKNCKHHGNSVKRFSLKRKKDKNIEYICRLPIFKCIWHFGMIERKF